MENKHNSLLPSMEKKGEIVTQIITFSNGNKKTFRGIMVDSICQGEFVHFELLDGRMIYVNSKNVDFFEVFSEEVTEKRIKEQTDNMNTEEQAKSTNY